MEITPVFNAASDGPEADGVASEAPTPHSPTPSGSTAEMPSEPSPMQSEFANAEAQVAVLEQGRVTPAPRLNLNPPTRIMRASHAPIERQREARVRALRAYAASFQMTEADENYLAEDLTLIL